MRRTIEVELQNITPDILIRWGKQFDPFILLNSNNEEQFQSDEYGKYDMLVAAGEIASVPLSDNIFSELKKNHAEYPDWLFGYFSYDVKNQLEEVSSNNFDGIKAPLYKFFTPRLVLAIREGKAECHYDDGLDTEVAIRQVLSSIYSTEINESSGLSCNVIPRVRKSDYFEAFEKIKNHIKRGDIYELNYCIEFFSEDALIDPPSVYSALNLISPMPFSAYMQSGDFFLMCASPERYLAKRKNKIISQPIKGTARRGKDTESDEMVRKKLSKDPKEQSENVMIVDMVRNDLSRTAARGSVKVEELFGVKTFKQLHQMISTVVSELNADSHFTDVIAKSFPMGSMTGAPKVSAMNLIEEFETTKRGIFSGSVGYITPDGDFDFNVVIRSIIYNNSNGYLSYMAGSAITSAANAEQEYEECMLKAEAMKKVLSGTYERV